MVTDGEEVQEAVSCPEQEGKEDIKNSSLEDTAPVLTREQIESLPMYSARMEEMVDLCSAAAQQLNQEEAPADSKACLLYTSKLPKGEEQISILGLGSSSMGAAGEKEIEKIVTLALENGINYFDMASADAVPFPAFGKDVYKRQTRDSFILMRGIIRIFWKENSKGRKWPRAARGNGRRSCAGNGNGFIGG